MSIPTVIKLISPSLDIEIKKYQDMILKNFKRKVSYRAASKIYAHIMAEKNKMYKLSLTTQKLNEILGAPDTIQDEKII